MGVYMSGVIYEWVEGRGVTSRLRRSSGGEVGSIPGIWVNYGTGRILLVVN